MSKDTNTTKAIILLLLTKGHGCPFFRDLRSDGLTKEHTTEEQACGIGKFCYGRFVPFDTIEPLELDWSTIISIAEPAALDENFGYMEDSQARSNVLEDFVLNNEGNSGAAGFTYLGQLLSHDINMDKTSIFGEPVNPFFLPNTNTPSVDLDTLYSFDGCTPKLTRKNKFRVNGRDFKRHARGRAKICDMRNDDHRIVSQLTVAWMTLHNTFVEEFDFSFEEARLATIKEWQAVILTDLLPNLLDNDVLTAVANSDRKLYVGNLKDAQALPVEFSTAAFRLFHSRARGRYRLNDEFDGSEGNPRARLFDIGNDEPILVGGSMLPDEMIIDWDRFFGDPTEENSKVELARIMDMLYSRPMMRLPFNEPNSFETNTVVVNCISDPVETCPISVNVPTVCPFGTQEGEPCELKANLALIDLLRGQTHKLPGGIALAKYVHDVLSVSDLNVLDFATMASKVAPDPPFGLPDELPEGDVPLLIYLAHEAIREQAGQRLGKLGSRIVAEVIFGLIETTVPSVLDGTDGFNSRITNSDTVTMIDVLDYIKWH